MEINTYVNNRKVDRAELRNFAVSGELIPARGGRTSIINKTPDNNADGITQNPRTPDSHTGLNA